MIDSQSRMAQAYGYLVCLIAVVVCIASLGGLVNSLFDYADPIHTDRYGSGLSVTSYNAYKRAYYQRQPRPAKGESDDATTAPPKGPVADSVSEASLRQMYQEDRTDHVDTTRFRALKNMVSAFLLLIVALILFSIHWKWLRRQSLQTA